MKQKYSKYLNDIQLIIGYKPSHSDISKILQNSGFNVSANALSNRLFKDGFLNDKEVEILNNHYNNNTNQSDDCEIIQILGNVQNFSGIGIYVNSSTVNGNYALSKKLLKEIGANAETSKIIFAQGDSMYPTIEGGDGLLVDLSKKELHDGKIYCVKIDNELYAKRLQKISNKKIKIISDNKEKYEPIYYDYSCNDLNFEIIGEILWWSRIAR